MKKKNLRNNKKIDYKRRGDKLHVELKDSNFNTIYEKEVNINDKRGMIGLVNDLRVKGVTFPKEWLGERYIEEVPQTIRVPKI